MSESPRLLHFSLRTLALGGVAWASLQLALLVAQLQFSVRIGSPPEGTLKQGMVLMVILGAGVSLYNRSDRVAALVWRKVRPGAN